MGGREDRDFSTFPAERVVLKRYRTVNVSMEVPLLSQAGATPTLRLLLRGENLLDAAYEEVVGFPAPGRALYVGVSMRFGGG